MDERQIAGGAIRGQPDPSAGGGLPDARLAERGRRRRAGSLAPAQPLRHERRREPRRLADDGRRARLPRHAALAQVAARGAAGRARSPSRSSASRGSTPSTKRCWPTRSASRCSWCSKRWLPPSGSRSCCTTCSTCPSTRSRRSSGARRPRRGSSRAAPAAGCRERPRSPTPIAPASARSSTPSSPPRAAATSTALLAVLDPDVVLRADPVAVQASAAARDRGAPALAPEVHGAAAVAETFSGRARAARPALINGIVGLVWAPGGQPRAVFRFTMARGKVVELELIADPERISADGGRDPQRLKLGRAPVTRSA